jgi:hypothetical protein
MKTTAKSGTVNLRTKWNKEAGRYDVVTVPYTVEIDWDALVQNLAHRAYGNKSKVARAFQGDLVVRVGTPAQGAWKAGK